MADYKLDEFYESAHFEELKGDAARSIKHLDGVVRDSVMEL